jgi:hypothetical protein
VEITVMLGDELRTTRPSKWPRAAHSRGRKPPRSSTLLQGVLYLQSFAVWRVRPGADRACRSGERPFAIAVLGFFCIYWGHSPLKWSATPGKRVEDP